MATTSERVGVQAPPRPEQSPRDNGHGSPQPSEQPHAPGPRPAGRQSSAEAAPAPAGRSKRLLLVIPIILIVATVAIVLGYRYWYDRTFFVSTENASVTGDLVQVGSLNAGRVVSTRFDVGAKVLKDQEIVMVALPSQTASANQTVAPRLDVTGTTDTLVPVYAPFTGVVAARMAYPGATVSAGQPIYSLVDPAQVWIKANIDESVVWRVHVGQEVEVHVDAVNATFTGRVEAITPAAAATFSLLPQGNASGNFTKVTQYIPIKIIAQTGGTVLPLGASADVRIKVREPGEGYPLPWQL